MGFYGNEEAHKGAQQLSKAADEANGTIDEMKSSVCIYGDDNQTTYQIYRPVVLLQHWDTGVHCSNLLDSWYKWPTAVPLQLYFIFDPPLGEISFQIKEYTLNL